MDPDIRRLLDRIADGLGTPVTLEDTHQRLIGYSEHSTATDAVREETILQQRSPSAVVSWLKNWDLESAPNPIRLPPRPDLKMRQRVCIPLRHGARVLGHLWVIEDVPFDLDRLSACAGAVDELVVELHRRRVAGGLSSGRVAEALRTLISGRAGASQAGSSLLDEGHLRHASQGVVAIAVQPVVREPAAAADVEQSIVQVLGEALRVAPRHTALPLTRRDHGVLVLTADNLAKVAPVVDAAARTAAALVAAHPWLQSCVVGVGSIERGVERTAVTHDHAQLALRAARTLRDTGDVVYWDRLGFRQLILKMAAADTDLLDPFPGLAPLFDEPRNRALVETLETYLDMAGNAQLAAERLFLHRTSLYYRLTKIEHITGADLRDGNDRLALHLAIKIARATGRYDGDLPIRHAESA